MLRAWFFGWLLVISAAHAAHAAHAADFITYDWLVDLGYRTGYTDHIPHFRRLFNTIKVRGFLECGCGYSTKYFLDHCDKVVSIEFLNPGCDDGWFNQCLTLYKGCSNWLPLIYNGDRTDQSFNQACAFANSEHRFYGLIDSSYLFSLHSFFKDQIAFAEQQGTPIDVAFVDPGVYIRGDMVKLLLNLEVPIVVAHDTNNDAGSDVDEGLYNWHVVKTPPDYEKISIPYGQGATFWVHKKLPRVIISLKAYCARVLHAQEQGVILHEKMKEFADHLPLSE
jgi:hypothetical protein